MRIFPLPAIGLAVVSLVFSVSSAHAQKLDASVLYRQDSDVAYVAYVPGHSGPQADTTGACTLDPDPANCPSSNPAPGEVNYTVVGTTISLELPGGRVALLNCVNRYSSSGTSINRRSCGMPLVQHVLADFKGQTAKLTWPVGQNGKMESETYKVIAVLDKHTETARSVAPESLSSH
jgi:hypothetical protein